MRAKELPTPVDPGEALEAARAALLALPSAALGDVTPPSVPGHVVIDVAYGTLLSEVVSFVEAALSGEPWHKERRAVLWLALEALAPPSYAPQPGSLYEPVATLCAGRAASRRQGASG